MKLISSLSFLFQRSVFGGYSGLFRGVGSVRNVATQSDSFKFEGPQYSHTKDTSDTQDSRDLVNRIYNLARSGQTSVEIWRDCVIKTRDLIDELDVKGICSILNSYGYMKYRDRNLLELISAKLIQHIRVLNSNQIKNILKAYSILNCRSDFLFRLMIPEISLRLDVMNVEQVSSIFYSYTNLAYYNSNLFEMIRNHLYQNLDKLKPYDLTLILAACCKNKKGLDDKFLTVLSFQFCKLIDSYDNKLFSLSVNSLSKLGYCRHKYLPSLIESEVYNRIKKSSESLSTKSLALIINGLSKHNDSCTPLFTFMSKTVLKRIKEFDFHSLCLVLSGLTKVKFNDKKAYDKIAEHIGRNSLKLYPRALSSILYSYGRIGHLYGPLFYFSGKHLQMNFSNYNFDEIAMIMKSYSTLNVKSEEVLESLSEYIIKNTPDYVPVKFEDQCEDLRVNFINELGVDNNGDISNHFLHNKGGPRNDQFQKNQTQNEKNEFDTMNINLLEVVDDVHDFSNSKKQNGNILSGSKIHSLLWIVEIYAKFSFINDQILRCLTRISNEIVLRMTELNTNLISKLLFAFSQLNFRHEACLETLLNEIDNPRKGYKFDQKQLELVNYSIKIFGMDPSKFGVYRIDRLTLQKNCSNSNMESVLKKVINGDIVQEKPLYLELLKNPLVIEMEDLKDDLLEDNEPKEVLEVKDDDEDSKMDLQGDDNVYIHVPRYLREMLSTKDKDGNQGLSANKSKLDEIINTHIKYNFNID